MHSNEKDWIVTEIASIYEAHMLEYGTIKFKPAEVVAPVSLHPFAVVSGQNISSPEVTIAAQTRVLFTSNISKNYTGVYTGVPGVECRNEKNSSTATLLDKEGKV
jgi:hypothetical protein